MSHKPPKYPSHLWTVEFHLGGRGQEAASSSTGLCIILHKSYPTEAAARAEMRLITPTMQRHGSGIILLRLFHKHTLLTSIMPSTTVHFTPAKSLPQPSPSPSPDGITRLPPRSRPLIEAIARTAAFRAPFGPPPPPPIPVTSSKSLRI